MDTNITTQVMDTNITTQDIEDAKKREPELTEETKTFAMFIAMNVRNAMEDFHCENLSDAQMAKLNPIIRNAICDALYVSLNSRESEACNKAVDFNMAMIPDYWEEPEISDEFFELSVLVERMKE